MDFNIIRPNNPIISEYLKYSYTGFLDTVSYYAYPHYNIPIAFFKNVNFTFKDEEIIISPSYENSIKCLYTNTFYKPVKIETTAKVEEFCLIFEPYGLAQFVKKMPLINSKTECFEFDCFNDFIEDHPNLFSYSSTKKSATLEAYLISKMSKKKHTQLIKKAINNLHEENTVQYIYPISTKAFYRAFKNICGIPESVLTKTILFRKALERIKTENPEKTMAQLAYDLGYYDQPHFNKLFKQLSEATPSTFFKQVDCITEENIYFKIK